MNLTRKQLRISGAAFALSAGLVACGNPTTTPPTQTDGKYNVTVKFEGVSGVQTITVKAADGTSDTYSLQSGVIIRLAKGTYTISVPTVGGKSPAAQTVVVNNQDQEITFKY